MRLRSGFCADLCAVLLHGTRKPISLWTWLHALSRWNRKRPATKFEEHIVALRFNWNKNKSWKTNLDHCPILLLIYCTTGSWCSHTCVPEKYLHVLSQNFLPLQLGREKFLTWEEVKVMRARSAAQRKSSASCTATLYNTVPSVLLLIACRSETFHFPVVLNALIEREYLCCQSKWAFCPRLGGDCCSSTEASCLVIQLP